MRIRTLLAVLTIATVASPSFASFGGGGGSSKPEPSSSNGSTVELDGSNKSAPRQEAAKWYGEAYNEVAKGKQDLADGKAKNAEKRFKKALDKGQRAAEIDTTYHEAFNLVGFTSRQLKMYDQSLAAYNRCLAIKPDYAPAHEYLGELYVDMGKPDQAREQLAWLESAKASEAAELKTRLATWDAEHPTTDPNTSKAPPDSSNGGGSASKP